MNKIKYCTERNGEFKEFPLNCQTIYLPNGAEYSLRYNHHDQSLEITKIYGAVDDKSIAIYPSVSNQIRIK